MNAIRQLLLAGLVLVLTPAFAAQVIEGRVNKVRDADTIVVDGVPVRFNGVDAPELNTRAGQDGRRWMVNAVGGQTFRCELTGEKTYDRWVGTCYIGDVNLSAAVIAAGHALDCRRYSGGRYRKYETPAAKSRIRRADYC